jgi:hypothetical protein
VSLNRPGSLWVFSRTGSPSWTWRGIWEYLAGDGDVDEAAKIVGAIAGLGMPEASKQPNFAQIAVDLLGAAPQSGWSWRSASPDGGAVPEWVDRFRAPLRRYGRTSTADGGLPAIARIWGAVVDGAAPVIVDQNNLRIWIWDGESVQSLDHLSPSERLEASAAALSANLAHQSL